MSRRIRIGNQTAFSASTALEPFEFALAHDFDAFEWFGDKKVHDDGSASGWGMSDMDESLRQEVKRIGERHDIGYSVHAPWRANPLWPEGNDLLLESLEFARSIGAQLVNLHLYMDEGAEGYVQALRPVVRRAGDLGLRISIENTPLTTPEDVNQTFAALRRLDGAAEHVGLCLDLGHANLCAPTRNDYIRYVDELAPQVPIIHAHVHENYGDVDSHLTLFSGPAGANDGGIRAFLKRLRTRRYSGALILEQWPEPRELLLDAERRLRPLLGRAGERPHQDRRRAVIAASGVTVAERSASDDRQAVPSSATPELEAIADPFIAELVAAHRTHPSWRERLAWVGERLSQSAAPLAAGELATLAAYLRFLGTGEVPCAEDGRHFRPNHHARTSLVIEERLFGLESADNAWIVRKILPWLPSHSDQFCRREPLTRIRDIAHRNDIPKDLKREIKHRLQNKLHRCAGPEDLKTSAEILARITEPGTDYSTAFVQQFEIFHEELLEFFNASGLEKKLLELQALLGTAEARQARAFLEHKAVAGRGLAEQAALLQMLTELRQALVNYHPQTSGSTRQRLRLADVALEDYAFALASEFTNGLESVALSLHWPAVLGALRGLVANVRLSCVEAQECAAIESELTRWSAAFDPSSEFELRRLLATLERAQRLGEHYSDKVLRIFADRVNQLGEALGVSRHAIAIFCEGDIRGNVVFQLSKLVERVRSALRAELCLPPWEALVPGEAVGKLVHVEALSALAPSASEALIVLLGRAEGDEEIPRQVGGILLAHPIPHLSHLAVRARQAAIPFASADGRDQLDPFQALLKGWVQLRVGAEALSLTSTVAGPRVTEGVPAPKGRVRPAVLTGELRSVSLAAAEPETCGAKATAAGRLLTLADESGLFRAPRGRVLPFGIMERCLSLSAPVQAQYERLSQGLDQLSASEQAQRLEELRRLLSAAPIPDELLGEVGAFFSPDAPLAVRSSANGEDLEDFAGAGLYESVIGVTGAGLADAVRAVWASLWTRRAALSRMAYGLGHDQVRMAVLVQEMVQPDVSFIMHTADPVTGSRDHAAVELALGLGETLASAAQPGSPYRLQCQRRARQARLNRLASFSFALRAGAEGTIRERIDYSLVPWSADAGKGPALGDRLIDIALLLEARLGAPQDVEGVVADEVIYLVQSRAQQGLC